MQERLMYNIPGYRDRKLLHIKEEVSPMATDASNQSSTVFYHKFVQLQFCKVGIFMGIYFLPKQSSITLRGTSSP